tara:strand:- start:7946 stop:9652 length:1707 start_codon:yes stop_codon:yes gene_type:complete
MLRLFFILFPDLKKKIYLLITLSIFLSFLDILSLGLIGPLIGLIIDENFFNNFPTFYSFLDLINIFQIDILIFISILIILCFLIKSIFSFQIIKFIQSFCYEQQTKLRNRILEYYLTMPFIFFIKKDYVNKFSSITELTRNVSESALINLLRLFSDLIIVLLISVYLFYTDFKISVFVLTLLFLTYLSFKFFLKNKILTLGKETVSSLKNIISGAEVTLNAIKEIRVFNKEKFFLHKMNDASKNFGKFNTQHILYSSLPKIIIENTLVITMLIVIFITISFNAKTEVIFSTLAIFGLAAIRLGPLTHNILSSYAQVWNSKYASETLVDQLNDFEKNKNKNNNNNKEIIKKIENKIQYSNCSFHYNEQGSVFSDLNFEFIVGESIGLHGQSGAGKTTFIYLLIGLLKFTKGKITIDEIEVDIENYDILDKVAYIPQDTFLLDDTIKNNILFDSEFNQKKFDQVVVDSNLSDVIDQMQFGINTRVGHMGTLLSGGQKQRLSIARALYNKKKFLIFDEPTSALDQKSKNEIMSTIKSLKGKQTIVVISHDISILKNFDKVYLLENKDLIIQ